MWNRLSRFSDKNLERFWKEGKAKALPAGIEKTLRRKLAMLMAAVALDDLRIPPSNHLEKLRGDLSGLYSIRVNDQWRLIFSWEADMACNINLIDYHKG
ncbi:MAG: type II toxin-antitoxin system RelE/ParE family toxin [Sedimentisphaerales bacterium]|nr:type II toxin-antitoxin system RelE/ParE family toxin [Sedimentisphaerales bacterium]MBN2842763.1 type II toxin-antitoxin system RelE/ParE family toxin [Sedimentisphaerales bacterium]